MRKDISAEASDGALLQRGMSGQGEAVVAMEKPTALAPFRERPEETTATKHSPSRTVAKDGTGTNQTGKRYAWVITDRSVQNFSGPRATVQVVMKVSNQRGARPCSDSVRRNAGAH